MSDETETLVEEKTRTDFRIPTTSKWRAPRAVVDAGTGTIIATAEVPALPERVFQALTTREVERWWGHPDFYRQTGWSADLRVQGQWGVTVVFKDGSSNVGVGEFAEIDPPRKLVMTRRFEKHPLQGTRETTITYRLDPIANGTRVTLRDEGFVGRSEAAFGNAEHWERVLGWLAEYFLNKPHYSHTITANIAPEEAIERISRVADWWTKGFSGAAQKIGDAFTVRFAETFVDFDVVELIPTKRLVWRVTDCNLHWIQDRTEWKGTEIAWDISCDGSATTVRMTHVGLIPAKECYNSCLAGWDFYLGESLEKLFLENQGMPDGRQRSGRA